MDINQATQIFSALSQDTRLRVLRLLVEAGHSGMPAGDLSKRLNIPHNTLSFHLNHLSHAQLVHSQRQGRSVIYCANFALVRDLIGFLVKDCCKEDFARIGELEDCECTVIELTQKC